MALTRNIITIQDLSSLDFSCDINGLRIALQLIDNGDGKITLADSAGSTLFTVDKADITDNGNGTYTFTNNDGSDVVISTTASSNPYDNTASGLTATNVQAAIDELDSALDNINCQDNGDGTFTITKPDGSTCTFNQGWTTVSDNGDGTHTFTYPDGATYVLGDTSITTILDNGDGTYTFTNELGATQVIDSRASSNPYNNASSGLVATNVQDAIDELDGLLDTIACQDNLNGTFTITNPDGSQCTFQQGWTTVTDNGDGTFTFIYPDGTNVVIGDASTSTLVDNLDGTYTYTNEVGGVTTVDTNADSNPYDNTTSGLASTDVQAAIDELDGLLDAIDCADNGNGTFTITKPDGSTCTFQQGWTTVAVDGNNFVTFTYPDGSIATYDETLTSVTQSVGNTDADVTSNDARTIATYVDESGGSTTINESVTSIVDNADGTFSYSDEKDDVTTINVCSILDNCELDALGNVVEAGKAVSDVLGWDGSNWVPVAPLQFGEFQGDFDATSGSFPGDINTEPGDWWAVTVAGTIDGVDFEVGDILIATVSNPSTTTFAGNWTRVPQLSNITGLVTVSDSTTVDLTLTGLGTAASPYNIEASAIIDPAANNDLSDSGSGLFLDVQAEETTTVIANTIAGNKIADYTNEDGVVVDIDETITSLAYDIPSNVLTYTAEGGGVTNIDLSDLQHISGQLSVLDSNCIDITLTGTGTQADPYVISAVPIISGNAGQLLSCEASGLFVDATIGQLTNVNSGADAPANANDILAWDGVAGEWAVLDMTSALNCAGLTP